MALAFLFLLLSSPAAAISDGSAAETHRSASLSSAAAAAAPAAQKVSAAERVARFGIITDVHYADFNTVGTRYYRDSLPKVGYTPSSFPLPLPSTACSPPTGGGRAPLTPCVQVEAATNDVIASKADFYIELGDFKDTVRFSLFFFMIF